MLTIPVLLYHSVNTTPPTGYGRWTVSPSTFDEHADAIVRSARESLTISELTERWRSAQGVGEPTVAITFDDGYADTLEAVRALHRRGLRSTVYVTTGTIGTPGMLTAADLRVMADIDGVEIGAHGVSHQHLDELPARAVGEEVRRSKEALELLLEAPVSSFAYPYGAYDRRTRATVIDAGYRSAAAVKNAASHPQDDPFAIARWTVTRDTTAEQLTAVLAGEGVPRAWSNERIRTRAYRAVRRARRTLRAATAVQRQPR